MKLLKHSVIPFVFAVAPFAAVAQSVSFDDLDINDDGVVSAIEAEFVLTDEQFSDLDSDENGELSIEEFTVQLEQ